MELEQKLQEMQTGMEAKAAEMAEAKVAEMLKDAEEKAAKREAELVEKFEKALSVKEEKSKTVYDAKKMADKWMGMLKEAHGFEYKADDVTLGDDTSLGYLAGHLYANDVAERRYKTSPIRDVATVMNIGQAADISLPYETDRTRAQWANELESGNKQKPKVGNMVLKPHRLTTNVGISAEMMKAGRMMIESYVRNTVSRDFALAENEAFIIGEGSAELQPTGIINAGITQGITSATAGEISFEDLFDLVAEIPQYNKVFVMNSKTIAELRKQKGNDQFLWTAPAENTPGTIAGIPYLAMEDMPDVATGAVPVILGDFSQYYIAENGGLEIIVDKFTRKSEGVTELQFTKFVDGNIRQLNAFAKLTIQ